MNPDGIMRQSFIGLGHEISLRGEAHVRGLLADGSGAMSVDEFSESYAHRWRLSYRWAPGPALVVIGMNPSKATCRRGDATVTRCARRAQAGGLSGLEMVNIYGFISTQPDGLFAQPERLRGGGLIGDQAILSAIHRADGGPILFAPGGDARLRARALHVEKMLLAQGHVLHCLGTTKDGLPRHPSRLGYDAAMVPWAGSYQEAA